jgi:hypothetical protein
LRDRTTSVRSVLRDAGQCIDFYNMKRFSSALFVSNQRGNTMEDVLRSIGFFLLVIGGLTAIGLLFYAAA